MGKRTGTGLVPQAISGLWTPSLHMATSPGATLHMVPALDWPGQSCVQHGSQASRGSCCLWSTGQFRPKGSTMFWRMGHIFDNSGLESFVGCILLTP